MIIFFRTSPNNFTVDLIPFFDTSQPFLTKLMQQTNVKIEMKIIMSQRLSYIKVVNIDFKIISTQVQINDSNETWNVLAMQHS